MVENKNVQIKKFQNKSSVCGSKYHTSYGYVLDKDTHKVKINKKKIDFSALAQASKDSCDISVILNKIRVGDFSVIQDNRVNLEDITNYPKTIHEVKRLNDTSMSTIEASYNSLSPELKLIYTNIGQYINALQNGSFVDVAKKFTSTPQQKGVENNNVDGGNV